MRRYAIAVALLSSACDTHAFHQLTFDGGVDAGLVVHTDAGGDAGTADAGLGVAITPPEITGPRRGPVILWWAVSDPAQVVTAVALERNNGTNWVAATVTTIERTSATTLTLWDSFADVSVDGPVQLRLVAATPGGSVSAELTIDVRNDPETDRLILSGHDLKDDGSGGATDDGTKVAVLHWRTATHALSGAPVDVEVGLGPHDLRASPNGRATAVLEDKAGTLSVLFTPLDAQASGVHLIGSMAPEGGVSDLRWSPEGRYLYAIVYGHDQVQPSLWRWEPREDLSALGPGTAIGTLPGPPTAFAVEPKTGRLLVSCGAGSTTGVPKLTVHDADGVELARLTKDIGVHQIAIHPLGGLALIVPDFFGEDIHRIRFSDTSINEEGMPLLSVKAPWEIVFHPQSTATGGAVLVSNQQHDTVTPMTLTATGETPGTPVPGVPLASEMDLIERGSQTGTVFVTAVSEIYCITLAVDGTTVNQGSVRDFGMNTEDLLSGIAVQR
jgi:dipeptidyl aminopeptidase/acylaminoacyl peptidase